MKRTRRTSLANGDVAATTQQNGNGVHSIPEDLAEKVGDKRDGKMKKKIDWEIPRKVFHSSIGASQVLSFFFVLSCIVTKLCERETERDRRILRHPPLYLEY